MSAMTKEEAMAILVDRTRKGSTLGDGAHAVAVEQRRRDQAELERLKAERDEAPKLEQFERDAAAARAGETAEVGERLLAAFNDAAEPLAEDHPAHVRVMAGRRRGVDAVRRAVIANATTDAAVSRAVRAYDAAPDTGFYESFRSGILAALGESEAPDIGVVRAERQAAPGDVEARVDALGKRRRG